MNCSADVLGLSYAACRLVSRQAKSNFYAGFLLLPPPQRRAMDALYAFMRHTDDLADNPQPVCQRSHALVCWRAELENALTGRFSPADTAPPADTATAGNDPKAPPPQSGRALLPALADTVERYQIPPEHLHAVIDGVEMDLKVHRYETFVELEQYCQRVASAVGLACIYIWGFRGAEAIGLARKCGIALQLTNILRDIGADAAQDRVYVPLADLRACGYTVDELMQGVADKRFERFMACQIERAEQYYREGAPLLELLQPRGRRVFGMIMAVYRTLLQRIQQHPADVLSRRIRLNRLKKLQIALRWALLPPHTSALL
jgi:15-cis-phytoene synthase